MSAYGYKPSNDSGLKKVAKSFNNSKAAKARKAAAKKKASQKVTNPSGFVYTNTYAKNTGLPVVLRASASGGSGVDNGYGTGGGGGGGGRSYSGGGGGGYSGPSQAELAAAAAAQAEAYRQQIIAQYATPTNRLYDEAVKASQSDIVRSNGAYDAARTEVAKYGQSVNVQADREQEQRRLAYGKAIDAMGLGNETALHKAASNSMKGRTGSIVGTTKVVDRNQAYIDASRKSLNEMYVTQRKNAGGRTKSYQDELNRQRKLQLDQIGKTYGVKL